MRRLYCFLLLNSLLLIPCFGQGVIPVADSVSIHQETLHMLAGTPQDLAHEPHKLESILDLVVPRLRDTTISHKTQRHVSFWGWFLDKALGMNWKVLETAKQKYVGTCSRTMEVFDGTAREVDINLFIMPHREPYVNMVRQTYERTLDHNRGSSRQFRVDSPPFPSPEELHVSQGGYYTVECEVTPAEAIRAELSEKVLPLQTGPNPLQDHPNFGSEYPSFGMMGPLCLDCNHNCRPEIHPVEWLWWLDLSPENPEGWEWMMVLLHDDTRRFDDWSPAPVEGHISIPFVFPSGAQSLRIRIEPLVAAGLMPLRMPFPAEAQRLVPGVNELGLGKTGKVLRVEIVGAVPLESVWWWPEGFGQDAGSMDIVGRIGLAVSTAEGFAARVSVSVNPW